MTRDEVRALLFDLPGVEDGTSCREPSFRISGRKAAPKSLSKAHPLLPDEEAA